MVNPERDNSQGKTKESSEKVLNSNKKANEIGAYVVFMATVWEELLMVLKSSCGSPNFI